MLPTEIWEEISNHANIRVVLRLRQVNKQLQVLKVKHYEYCNEDYMYGKKYQLLIDFYSIKGDHYMTPEIRSMVNALSKDEVNMMAEELSCKSLPEYSKWRGINMEHYKCYKKYVDTHNLRAKDMIKVCDYKYYGRCVQFLLDSSRNKYEDLMELSVEVVTELAEDLWTKILYKKAIKRTYKIKHNIWSNAYDCAYRPSNDNNRCDCGNQICELEYDVATLNAASLHCHVTYVY